MTTEEVRLIAEHAKGYTQGIEDFLEVYNCEKLENFMIDKYGKITDVMNLLSSDPEGTIKAFQEWKEENRIKVGDEVYITNEDVRYCVTLVAENRAVIMAQNGHFDVTKKERLHRTGRHYGIENILEGLRMTEV